MERVNPAIKTILLLLLGLVLSFNNLIWVDLVILVLCAVGLIGAPVDRKKAFSILGAALLIAVSLFFTAVWFGRGQVQTESLNFSMAAVSISSLRDGLHLALRILSFAGLGVLFTFTTKPDELVASYIHQLHVSPKYAYGVLAAFHCAGHIRAEYQKVRLAFQVRGIHTSLFSVKPLFVMLVNALYWSGDLSAAMESKGFDGTRNRTYYKTPSISRGDLWFILLCTGLMATCILCNWLYA